MIHPKLLRLTQTSRRNPSKAASSKDSPKSNTELGNKEDFVPTSDRVEVVDLTCLGRHPYNRRSNLCLFRHCAITNTNAAREVSSEISSSGGGEDSDDTRNDGLLLQNEWEGVELKQTVLKRSSRKDTEDENSNQPAHFDNSSQGKRLGQIVIVAPAHHF
jgi:hypothetical protein